MTPARAKIHLDLDGLVTACGLPIADFGADSTIEMRDVTCQACYREWNKTVTHFDREQQRETALAKRGKFAEVAALKHSAWENALNKRNDDERRQRTNERDAAETEYAKFFNDYEEAYRETGF